jgi:inhibitor of KinA
MTTWISLIPLGDQAVLVNLVDELTALGFAELVRNTRAGWIVDVVSAYSTVAVFFDLEKINYASARKELERLSETLTLKKRDHVGRRWHIPCCYQRGQDFQRVVDHTGLPVEEVILRHAGNYYTVYAIGFCPGFPYLGYLPPELCGVPRLATPRLRVEAGSVALTGRQTGIYTENRPGGWNVIGQTPLLLVDVREGYFPLRPGDQVRFEPIDEKEYQQRKGQRLAAGTNF